MLKLLFTKKLLSLNVISKNTYSKKFSSYMGFCNMVAGKTTEDDKIDK